MVTDNYFLRFLPHGAHTGFSRNTLESKSERVCNEA